METYLNLVRDVMSNGESKTDRTGTGTTSVFGRQARFDLRKGFPCLTTKKLHLRSIIEELLWFLKGDTNIKALNNKKVSIWDEWASPEGDLGPVYSACWRSWPGNNEKIVEISRKGTPDRGQDPPLDFVLEALEKDDKSPLETLWARMLSRCYNPADPDSDSYRGAFVTEAWHSFENFEKDATSLQGYANWSKNPTTYVLSHLYHGAGYFGPDSAIFLPATIHLEMRENFPQQVVIEKDGESRTLYFPSVENLQSWVSEQTELGSDRYQIGPYRGDKLIRRALYIDQIQELIERLKKDPDSRRHLVIAWNPGYSEQMALTPCHCLFQFYVHNAETEGGKRGLSCQLYQRSADIFLGVPFNIASYALLTMMIAQACGYEAREFVHTFGDLHLYSNHVEQAELQLTREPRDQPTMWIDPTVTDIDGFTFESFRLENYDNPHPSIKAPIAV